jgi:hypothetical protein
MGKNPTRLWIWSPMSSYSMRHLQSDSIVNLEEAHMDIADIFAKRKTAIIFSL